jgi:hypothetical protein
LKLPSKELRVGKKKDQFKKWVVHSWRNSAFVFNGFNVAVPAKLAGCQEIVLCSPPDKNGKINPAILYALIYVALPKYIKWEEFKRLQE